MTLELDCHNLREVVKGFSLVQDCDVLKSGALRIATPFSYMNGSQIDLFLESDNGLFPQYVLSDYGQTANYLLDLHIRPWNTTKRRRLIQDVCDVLEVHQASGAFKISLGGNLSDLSAAIVRLAQACIRVADFSFTQRMQTAGTFQEDVEEFISDASLTYEPDVELIGKFGNVVKVDFQVHGKRVNSLVQTLSTPTPTNAHAKSVELFSRWYDLRDYHPSYQCLTVYDTTTSVYKEYDFKRLQEMSIVLGFPEEQEEIREVLAA